MSNPTRIPRLHASNSNSSSASKTKSYPSSFRKPSSFLTRLRNTTSTYQEYNSEYTQSTLKKTGPFLFNLCNMVTSYQALLERSLNPVLGIPLTGAREGLVRTITSQDCIIHWPGSVPEDSSTRLVDTTTTTALPYQEGDSICDLEASTKVINNSDSTKTNADDRTTHAREVFMIHHPRSPLVPLEAPDVRSSDESESNISPFTQGHDGETES